MKVSNKFNILDISGPSVRMINRIIKIMEKEKLFGILILTILFRSGTVYRRWKYRVHWSSLTS